MSDSRARWYGKPVAAVCVAAAAVAMSARTLAVTEFGGSPGSGGSVCVVSLSQYGTNAREMESLVAIPLEDMLASLPGVIGTSSSCEYGEARVVARFAEGRDGTEAVSAAAQRLYESLPRSVQRPRISSARDDVGPAWVAAAVSDVGEPGALRALLERRVKPALESLAGVGEVSIDGGGVTELAVLLDDEAAALVGLSAEAVAESLAGSDGLVASGSLRSGYALVPVSMEARYPTVESIREAVIPGGTGEAIRLGSIARVDSRQREPESLSRVDGRRAVTIAVMPTGDANLARLSRDIAREAAKASSACGIGFTVLSDRGELAARSLKRVISAAIEAVVVVSVAAALVIGPRLCLGRSRVRSLAMVASAAMVPFILVVSAAILSCLMRGLSVGALAGLAIGLGSSIDCSILVAERLGSSKTVGSGAASVRELAPALAAGTATTILALAPMFGLEAVSPGVGAVAAGIAVTCGVSYAATIAIMPPVVLWGGDMVGLRRRSVEMARRLHRLRVGRPTTPRARRQSARLLAAAIAVCAERPRLVLAWSAAIGLAGVVAISISPKDVGTRTEGRDLYARLEFDQGLPLEAVDSRLADYAASLARLPGLVSTQSSARRGSANLLLTYDDDVADSASLAASAKLAAPAGSFLWIESRAPDERVWELLVRGDDDETCRSMAAAAAERIAALPLALEVALNFKVSAPAIVVKPDRDRSSAMGLPFSIVAGAMRRSVQAPVAYKRVGDTGDTDVRVGASRRVDEEALGSIVVASRGGATLEAASLVRIGREERIARIQRRDRRRSASLSIRTRRMDPEKAARETMAALEGLVTPPGYTLTFDRDAIEAARRLRRVTLSFVAAVALAYMAMAALSESFGLPLVALAAVPPSLAAPALILVATGSPLDASMACAFVAVSGVAVNASVLMADYIRKAKKVGFVASAMALYRVVRSRIVIVSATAATTVVGAIPLLVLDTGDMGMVRALAFVTACGGAASFMAAVTVVPALAAGAPRLFDRFGPSAPPRDGGD